MFGAILKATNSSFQKGLIFCRSIYVTSHEILGPNEVPGRN